jgi:glutamine synthetase
MEMVKKLKQIEERLSDELGLFAFVAGEIEFYLEPHPFRDSKKENEILAAILLKLKQESLEIEKLEKEVAEGQYEISLTPKPPHIAADEISRLKNSVAEAANALNMQAIFHPKPYDDKPGCGLHIHVGLHDKDGNSVLIRDEEKNESEIMLHAIGGLCANMLKDFEVFAPNEESYKRFSAELNKVHEDENPMVAHNNAPVNVSWGGNNRTTAIRIPASSVDETKRHIEHRVAGVDANPEAVIEKILEAIIAGLINKITPPEKIYGNAYDEQYSFLERFPLKGSG